MRIFWGVGVKFEGWGEGSPDINVLRLHFCQQLFQPLFQIHCESTANVCLLGAGLNKCKCLCDGCCDTAPPRGEQIERSLLYIKPS